jgi:hypothetical protein
LHREMPAGRSRRGKKNPPPYQKIKLRRCTTYGKIAYITRVRVIIKVWVVVERCVCVCTKIVPEHGFSGAETLYCIKQDITFY